MRIVGVELPSERCVFLALTNIKGIGIPTAKKIVRECSSYKNVRMIELSEDQIAQITSFIEYNYSTNNNLRLSVTYNIKRILGLVERVFDRSWGLPVKGQSTQSKAKTAKKMRIGGKRHYVK